MGTFCRTVYRLAIPSGSVRVCLQDGEYQVRFYKKHTRKHEEELTYFTTDRSDALHTAHRMAEAHAYRSNPSFTASSAKRLMTKIGARIPSGRHRFTYEDVAKGMRIELEHGSRRKLTDVTHNDPVATLKIALAHLYERPDYYELLARYVER